MFRLNSKSIFLTYPQCTLSKEAIRDELKRILPTFKFFCVAEEKHKDGAPHIHALFVLTNSRDIRNERLFDIEDFHPNIQSCRKIKDVLKYIQKDGVFESTFPDVSNEYKRLVDESSTSEEFIAKCMQYDPKKTIHSFTQVQAASKYLFKKATDVYVAPAGDIFNVSPVITSWVTEMAGVRPMTLLMIGPTRTGKTRWARSLGPHVYWNSYSNANKFKGHEASYIVIDDVPFDKVLSRKAIWGAQEEFEITDKYMGKLTVKWGKPCIFICNEEDDPRGSEHWNAWYRQNCKVIKITAPLFTV